MEKRLLRKSIDWFLLAVLTFAFFYFLPVTLCNSDATALILILIVAWASLYELKQLGFRSRWTGRYESNQYYVDEDITRYQSGYAILASSCSITIIKQGGSPVESEP